MNNALLMQGLILCAFCIAGWWIVERFSVDPLLTNLAKLVIFIIAAAWVLFKLVPAVF